MTIREALETVDRLKPNQYGSADKLRCVLCRRRGKLRKDVGTGAGRSPEKTWKGELPWKTHL